MNKSDQINELLSALAKAQGQMTPAIKDSLNPHFKSKYADLGSVWEACRAALSQNGLSVVQTVVCEEGSQKLETLLGHSSGQWISSVMLLPVQTPRIQELGSCLSYCRRYALASIVGVYSDSVDDDGESASRNRSSERVVHINEKVKYIDEDQCRMIEEFLKEFPESRQDFLNRYNIQSVHQLPLSLFSQVVTIFEKKRTLANV